MHSINELYFTHILNTLTENDYIFSLSDEDKDQTEKVQAIPSFQVQN